MEMRYVDVWQLAAFCEKKVRVKCDAITNHKKVAQLKTRNACKTMHVIEQKIKEKAILLVPSAIIFTPSSHSPVA